MTGRSLPRVGLLVALGLLLGALAPLAAQVRLRFVVPPVVVGGGGTIADILAANRLIDWTGAGATIVNRSTICTTLSAPQTAAQITTAMTTCSAGGGGVVALNAGTYNITSGVICMKDNVTLRGAGAASTILNFSGGGGACNAAFSVLIEFNGASTYVGGSVSGFTTATWSAGYAKGTTAVTLSTTANLVAGHLMFLDQADDSTTRVTGLWNNSATGFGAIEGPGATWFRDSTHNQVQVVRVTNVSGTNVTIDPPLVMPNWAAGKSPGAYWPSGAPLTSAGLENLTVDFGDSTVDRVIRFEDAYNSWIKGIRMVGAVKFSRTCLLCFDYASVHNTFRDSYVFGTKILDGGVSTLNYGVNFTGASSTLIENTIWHQVPFPFIQGVAGAANVFGHNYTYSNWYTPDGDPNPSLWPSTCGVELNCIWMQPSNRYHGTANDYTLYEGNDTNGSATDSLHGPSFFGTMFRNFLQGWELEGGAPDAVGKQDQTVPANLYALTRYMNYVGNVMGTAGKHPTYECATATNTDSCATYNATIWVLGYSGNGANTSPVNNDGQVKLSLLRWGNYDTATGTTRFVPAEVPTAEAFFPNAVPASQTLPASAYLAAKPAWWGAGAWPAIGPDVTGTLGPGNHVTKIPARLCYESLSVDAAYGTQNVLNFTSGSGACPSVF